MSRYRVTFNFEARDDREVNLMLSQPDLLIADAEMRIENVSRKWDLRLAALASPFLLAVMAIGYRFAAAWLGL